MLPRRQRRCPRARVVAFALIAGSAKLTLSPRGLRLRSQPQVPSDSASRCAAMVSSKPRRSNGLSRRRFVPRFAARFLAVAENQPERIRLTRKHGLVERIPGLCIQARITPKFACCNSLWLCSAVSAAVTLCPCRGQHGRQHVLHSGVAADKQRFACGASVTFCDAWICKAGNSIPCR